MKTKHKWNCFAKFGNTKFYAYRCEICGLRKDVAEYNSPIYFILKPFIGIHRFENEISCDEVIMFNILEQ